MRVLLDTTYLLPPLGVEGEGVSRDVSTILKKEGHTPSVSETSVFELLAEGSKLTAKEVIPRERVSLAIQSLYKDESIIRVSLENPDVVRYTIELRPYHSDTVDCVIIASALTKADIMLTEDKTLLYKNTQLRKAIRKIKPNLKIIPSAHLPKLHP